MYRREFLKRVGVGMTGITFSPWIQGEIIARVEPTAKDMIRIDDYQMVFEDGFDGTSLDGSLWDSQNSLTTSASGQKVYRQPANAVVTDGLLKLMVKKENVDGSQWTAAFVWLKKVYPVNTYYEARFINTAAMGVNNAFWISCKTNADADTRAYQNRYEIDCPESKLHTDGKMHAHLAWHDWKTYPYVGNNRAQGTGLTLDNTDSQTWGLWIGETEFIIYYEREEIWRGKTHPSYTHQYYSGIGKFPTWYPAEEQRAYGKHGQDDWCYYGGMNGDLMNICFSTMPWENARSPLTDSAHNTFMGIDYLRIYRPKSELDTSVSQRCNQLINRQDISLDKPIDLSLDNKSYFSFLINKRKTSKVSVVLSSERGRISTFTIEENNALSLKTSEVAVSTETAYPASQLLKTYLKNNADYLVVGRITSKSTEKDIISFKTYEMGREIGENEPFLYHNIDEHGNTNMTSEWDLSQKVDACEMINTISFEFGGKAVSIWNFVAAPNYVAVVNDYIVKSTTYVEGQ